MALGDGLNKLADSIERSTVAIAQVNQRKNELEYKKNIQKRESELVNKAQTHYAGLLKQPGMSSAAANMKTMQYITKEAARIGLDSGTVLGYYKAGTVQSKQVMVDGKPYEVDMYGQMKPLLSESADAQFELAKTMKDLETVVQRIPASEWQKVKSMVDSGDKNATEYASSLLRQYKYDVQKAEEDYQSNLKSINMRTSQMQNEAARLNLNSAKRKDRVSLAINFGSNVINIQDQSAALQNSKSFYDYSLKMDKSLNNAARIAFDKLSDEDKKYTSVVEIKKSMEAQFVDPYKDNFAGLKSGGTQTLSNYITAQNRIIKITKRLEDINADTYGGLNQYMARQKSDIARTRAQTVQNRAPVIGMQQAEVEAEALYNKDMEYLEKNGANMFANLVSEREVLVNQRKLTKLELGLPSAVDTSKIKETSKTAFTVEDVEKGKVKLYSIPTEQSKLFRTYVNMSSNNPEVSEEAVGDLNSYYMSVRREDPIGAAIEDVNAIDQRIDVINQGIPKAEGEPKQRLENTLKVLQVMRNGILMYARNMGAK